MYFTLMYTSNSICQQIWKTQQWPQDWKRSTLIPIPKKGSTKECASHQTIALIFYASNVKLKILHARIQHYANQELPDVQAEFRKGRETRDQIANIRWIIEKPKEFQKKTSTSVLSTPPKPMTVFSSVQLLSQDRLFVTPVTSARQASLSITNSRSLLKLKSIESVMPSNHLILCHPLLLLPSIFPSTRVFSNEPVLRIRWPKYWSFSISSFNEYLTG